MRKKLWFLPLIAVFLLWVKPALAEFYIISVPAKSLKNIVTNIVSSYNQPDDGPPSDGLRENE